MLQYIILNKLVFCFHIGLGAITVILWNILLKDLTGFDGFIPGMIVNSLFFYLSIKTHTIPFKA